VDQPGAELITRRGDIADAAGVRTRTGRIGPLVSVAGFSVLVLASCGDQERPPETATVVDSILPIDEEVRRFQATIPEAPAALSGGAESLDALVDRFVRAVEAADTAALVPLVLTRAEFAYLYYPHTRFTRAPYQLSPSLLWFQIENGHSRGLTRLFQRFWGRPIGALGRHCEERPRQDENNREWEECRLLLAGAAGDTASVRLFGSVLQRGGVFKFVSLSNEL
jgi:hypothetical protein